MKLNLKRVQSYDAQLKEFDTLKLQLQTIQDKYLKHVYDLCITLSTFLANLDEPLNKDQDYKPALLKSLIRDLNAIDGTYLQSLFTNNQKLNTVLQKLQADGIIILEDDVIKVKSKDKTINVRDIDDVLTVNDIKLMTDLEYIFSLNAYYLPYCEASRIRSKYEPILLTILNKMLPKSDPDNMDWNRFMLLQETITAISITTQLSVAIVECIIEIINVVNSRLKTTELTINGDLKLKNPLSNTLKRLLELFNDDEKVFVLYKDRLLINNTNLEGRRLIVINGKKIKENAIFEDVNWTTKINTYITALINAFPIYEMNCLTFKSKMIELKTYWLKQNDISVNKEKDPTEDFIIVNSSSESYEININNISINAICLKYCDDVLSYIDNFHTLINNLSVSKSVYQNMIFHANDMLAKIDELQDKFPIIYSSSRNRSPLASLGFNSPKLNRSSDGNKYLKNLFHK